MSVKIGNETITVLIQGGETYGAKETLVKYDIPCRRLPGEGVIEWVALQNHEVKYTAKRRTWYTRIEGQPPDILKPAGLKWVINNYPRELKTDDSLTLTWNKDQVVVSYRNI